MQRWNELESKFAAYQTEALAIRPLFDRVESVIKFGQSEYTTFEYRCSDMSRWDAFIEKWRIHSNDHAAIFELLGEGFRKTLGSSHES